MKVKNWILILVLAVALGLAGCTRSASNAPTAVPGEEATPETEQQPPSNLETAVAGGGFATQTAEAASGGQGEQQQEQTPVSPTETPDAGAQATPVPTDTGGESPTAAPAATEAPASGSCTSPYTVQSGEWVWSIGRKCNILPQAIIDANNLACYYDLAGRLQCPVYSGTKLILPANAPPFVGP